MLSWTAGYACCQVALVGVTTAHARARCPSCRTLLQCRNDAAIDVDICTRSQPKRAGVDSEPESSCCVGAAAKPLMGGARLQILLLAPHSAGA